MSKEFIISKFTDSIEKNYDNLLKYYKYFSIEFCSIRGIKIEILNSLLIDNYESSICTTNYFLERLLKLALIKKYTIEYKIFGPLYNEKLEKAIALYDDKSLSKTIDLACENSLIDSDVKKELTSFREDFRNPYSHANISKINKQFPSHIGGFMFDINKVSQNISKGEKATAESFIQISKNSPAFAQHLQRTRSKNDALPYFDYVFNLLVEFEQKITELKNNLK